LRPAGGLTCPSLRTRPSTSSSPAAASPPWRPRSPCAPWPVIASTRPSSRPTSAHAEVPRTGLVEVTRATGPTRLHVDSVLALPELMGPAVRGLPAGAHGFIPVDRFGRVPGAQRVFAAGDATDFRVKHGGVAAQQADAVALGVAVLAGVPVKPRPFRPDIDGLLLTGGFPVALSGQVTGARGASSQADEVRGSTAEKIARAAPRAVPSRPPPAAGARLSQARGGGAAHLVSGGRRVAPSPDAASADAVASRRRRRRGGRGTTTTGQAAWWMTRSEVLPRITRPTEPHARDPMTRRSACSDTCCSSMSGAPRQARRPTVPGRPAVASASVASARSRQNRAISSGCRAS
jgi:hypothetical protein